ncbi:hypothetical protein VT84_25415 [Gemmata sp. SH-PL17]|uniref:hypothetical protein n=1 Tax=Gemmata sp. SH-PL17 TaxID=1630693 RepID=UPI00078DA758|nr:hypothetical protein [Gemmata sp. SH-PL17]AMV27766.1 hypothetical protein VT84_25415 [Gemmata sp. SH-PL17]
MKRFVTAAVMVAALGLSAGAQPPPPQKPTTPPPPAPPVGVYPTLVAPAIGSPAPNVFVPPGTPPGPAIPFYKSGGLAVGVYGLYPYDSGHWLLGGTDGTTRQSGAFTMVFPEAPATEVAAPVGPVTRASIFHGKARTGLFCR